MHSATYASFLSILLIKWFYGPVSAADDFDIICSTTDDPYIKELCSESANGVISKRALSDDFFLRFGRMSPILENKRFLRFGRGGGSLHDALRTALNKLNVFEQKTGARLRKRRSADAPEAEQIENEEPAEDVSRTKRSDEASSDEGDDIQKRFMRFGKRLMPDDDSEEIEKEYMGFGDDDDDKEGDTDDMDGNVDKRFMRFGKRFMRFGRDSPEKRFMRFGRDTPEKRFMRFGKRFMRFGRDSGDDVQKRFMRFGKRFMRFGRDSPEKRFMRFGRDTPEKRFMRFGRDSGDEVEKRFMRFGRDAPEKRFMRFGRDVSAVSQS